MENNVHKFRIFVAALLVFSISMDLVACNGKQDYVNTFSGENPFSQDFTNGEDVAFAYGFGIISPAAEETIKYDGKPIEIEYYIDNAGAKMSTGMSIFVNGIPQAYRVVDSKDETYMHIAEVPEKTVKKTKISLVPVTGTKGEILNIRFISILNPQVRPNKLEYLFAHTNSMTTFLPRKIEMLEDSPLESNQTYKVLPPERKMTKEELDKVIYTDSKGNQIDKFKRFNFSVADAKNHNQSYIANNNGELNILMQSYGGPEEKYLIIPYLNHVEFSSDIFPGILSITSGHNLFEEYFSINIDNIDKAKYKIEEYNTFYVLAVPLSGSSEADPVISGSLVFKGE